MLIKNRFSLTLISIILIFIITLLLVIGLIWQRYQYLNTSEQSDTGIFYVNKTIIDSWAEWKTRNIHQLMVDDIVMYRVERQDEPNVTISEGQAYAMLFSVTFDEQDVFDGLWRFTENHINQNGLMHWRIGDYGEILEEGAATDADLDMALALIIACYKTRNQTWAADMTEISYCAEADTLIDAIWNYEVDKPGNHPSPGIDTNLGWELLPGDNWDFRTNYPDGITNLSYFSPAYFRVFMSFTNDTRWQNVIDRNYEIANLASNLDGNCSNLVANWTTYQGIPQPRPQDPNTHGYWGWDAGRFAWRTALDVQWYQDETAQQHMNDIGSFFSSSGIRSVGSEYTLDGNYVHRYQTPFFIAHATVAIWSAAQLTPVDCGAAEASLTTTPQEAFDYLIRTKQNDYYNDAWRLFVLLLMTDQFPLPETYLEQ